MAGTAPLPQPAPAGRKLNLVLATSASVVAFWAWNSVAPLGCVLHRSRCGSIRAIPACWSPCRSSSARWAGSSSGTLTDRYGGRVMFTVVLLAHHPVRPAGGRWRAPSAPSRWCWAPASARGRRHGLRRRHPLRQRLVRAVPAGFRHRRLRRRDGRDCPRGFPESPPGRRDRLLPHAPADRRGPGRDGRRSCGS